jgi:hypothetical protein
MMVRRRPQMLRQPVELQTKTAARSTPRAIRQTIPTQAPAAWSARPVQPLAAALRAKTTWALPVKAMPERALAALVRLAAKPPSAAAEGVALKLVEALRRVAAGSRAAAGSRVAAALLAAALKQAAAGSRVAVALLAVVGSRVAVAARRVATAAVQAKAAALARVAAAQPGARVLVAVADEADAAAELSQRSARDRR